MKLYAGMKFKPLSDPGHTGVCLSISEGQFTYRWYNENGEPENFIRQMKLKEAQDCFELYGWKELSELEKELI